MQILMYHEVTDGEPPNVHAVSRAAFADQMAWLARSHYQVVTLDHALTSPQRDQIVLTFDDGYVDFMTNALPVLQQHRFPATLYVITSLIGETRWWPDGEDYSHPALMDWAQIRAVQAADITIGAHTVTHPDMTRVSRTEAWDELIESKRMLTLQLGQPITHFCFPYGRYTAQLSVQAQEAGYRSAMVAQPHFVGRAGRNPFALQRISVLAQDSAETLQAKLSPTLHLRRRWITYRTKRQVKRLTNLKPTYAL